MIDLCFICYALCILSLLGILCDLCKRYLAQVAYVCIPSKASEAGLRHDRRQMYCDLCQIIYGIKHTGLVPNSCLRTEVDWI